MIKAALTAAILCATLVGSVQAAPKEEDPCLIGPVKCIPWPHVGTSQPGPVKQGGTKTQSVTPSIPIPPPVRSR